MMRATPQLFIVYFLCNEIKEILGNIQTHQVDLSNLGFITFSKVKVSPDLKNAKVFFTVLNEKQKLKSSCKIYIEFSKFTKIEIPDSFTIYKEKTLGDVKAYLLKYDN